MKLRTINFSQIKNNTHTDADAIRISLNTKRIAPTNTASSLFSK